MSCFDIPCLSKSNIANYMNTGAQRVELLSLSYTLIHYPQYLQETSSEFQIFFGKLRTTNVVQHYMLFDHNYSVKTIPELVSGICV